MKAPDIIYTDGRDTYAPAPIFSNADGNVKYIRADLAELTWEDISEIRGIMFELNNVIRYEGHIPTNEEYCKEVLRSFLESKTRQGCGPD